MGRTNRFPVYSRLVRLYPEPYRSQYGPQALQTLADMLDGAPDKKARTAIYIRLFLDTPASLAQQYIVTAGGIMLNMPGYIKRNALIGTVLLIPFALALLANAAARVLYNRDLYSSWLWHAPVLSLWVLWLPLAATLLALGTAAYFVVQDMRERKGTTKIARDLPHSWPVLVVAILGLGILAVVFGHDSGHCLMQNPVTSVTHVQQTWQCIQQGSANYPFHHPLEFLKRAFGL